MKLNVHVVKTILGEPKSFGNNALGFICFQMLTFVRKCSYTSAMINVAKDELIPLDGEPFKGRESVASRFDVGRFATRSWRTSGRLECVRVGGRWFTTAEALNDFAQDSSEQAANKRQAAKSQRTNPRYLAAKEKLEQQFG